MWNVSRNYRFLLRGTSVSEREISRRSDLSRRTLIRVRKSPYDYLVDPKVSTAEKIGAAFDLSPGWMCLTTEVCAGMGIALEDPVRIGRAEDLRDQYPELTFREGSKLLVLVAQNAPPDEARAILV